jgi:hypothetical protein
MLVEKAISSCIIALLRYWAWRGNDMQWDKVYVIIVDSALTSTNHGASNIVENGPVDGDSESQHQ